MTIQSKSSQGEKKMKEVKPSQSTLAKEKGEGRRERMKEEERKKKEKEKRMEKGRRKTKKRILQPSVGELLRVRR